MQINNIGKVREPFEYDDAETEGLTQKKKRKNTISGLASNYKDYTPHLLILYYIKQIHFYHIYHKKMVSI